MRAATRASTASPRAWPCSSLIDLKRSMSTSTIDSVRWWRVALRTSAESWRVRKRRVYSAVSWAGTAGSSRPRSRSKSWSRRAAVRSAARTRDRTSASLAGHRSRSSARRAWMRSAIAGSIVSSCMRTAEMRKRSGSVLIEPRKRSGPFAPHAASSTSATCGASVRHAAMAALASVASTISASTGRSAAPTAARTSGSLWATRTFTAGVSSPAAWRSALEPDICSMMDYAGAEADRVARQAGPATELEHTGGVAAVLDDRVGPGVLDLHRVAVDLEHAAALDDRPDGPGLVGARVRAGLVGSGDGDQRLGVVLGVHRAEGLALEAEQLLDDRLGVGVGALAVVVVDERQALVEQVARRPALVLVEVPHRVVGVEQHGVPDAQARDRRARGGVVASGREAGGVHGDDAQARGAVALVPGAHVGQRAQRVGATEVPELDEHRPTDLLVHAQRRHVDPFQVAREGRRDDGVDRGTHGLTL